MRQLTELQRKTLAFIEEHLSRHGKAPTIREMLDGLGLAHVATVSRVLDSLEKKRYIRRGERRWRNIQLLRTE